jgi:hypothetical protein
LNKYFLLLFKNTGEKINEIESDKKPTETEIQQSLSLFSSDYAVIENRYISKGGTTNV